MYYYGRHHHDSLIARRQHAALQRFGARVIADVAADDEPISLAEAKLHLRIDGTTDDTWLTTLGIPSAREYCETFLGRSLATRTLELSSNRFPTVTVEHAAGPYIELPFGPVQSITSVTYKSTDTDSSGDYPTLDFEDSNGNLLCALDRYVTPNRVVLNYGESWPATLDTVNSVKVRYVTGYVSTADTAGNDVLPRAAYTAMVVMLNYLYANRGELPAVIPPAVESLLDRIPNREALGMA